MSALYLLVGFSLLVALAFLGAFFWALRNGQYADTTTPALRVLFEDRAEQEREEKIQSKEVSNGRRKLARKLRAPRPGGVTRTAAATILP